MTVSKFKVGDRVYAPFHGYGVVVEIKDDGREYPIIVTWDEKKHGCISIFTPEGFAIKGFNCDDTDLTLVEKASLKGEKEMEDVIPPKKDKKEGKFKVGDRVRSLEFGVGVVDEVIASDHTYPITVKWAEGSLGDGTYSSFTSEGHYYDHRSDAEKDITLLEGGEKEMEECINFKAGDRVYFNSNGYGTITKLTQSKTELYPIEVKWDDTNITSTFTKDGYVWRCHTANDPKLSIVNKANRLAKDMSPEDRGADEMGQITGVIHHNDDGVADRMMYALAKRQDDAINPSHYKVKGIPEAIEIMEHLMTKEQMEGFLWGNIIKYVYRYGRKGDKAETAGKIAWYATKLKELEECESK